MIHPELEQMPQATIVVVVKEDCLLTWVAVEPFALGFKEYILEVVSCVSALTYTRLAVDPGASTGSGLSRGELSIFEFDIVDISLNLDNLAYRYHSGSHGLDGSELHDLLITAGGVSFLIFPSRAYSKSEGPVKSSLLLVAVFINSIILLNYYIVRVFTEFAESFEAFFLFLGKLEVVLYMWRLRLPFLQLTRDIHSPRCMPLL